VSRFRLALAAVLAAVAVSPASPAHAHPHHNPSKAERCEQRLDRLEARFYEIAEKRGYEYATEWWEGAWQRYYERCELPA
jgi:hypothetical protein